MIRLLLVQNIRHISVYEGISPSLLATMSLSVNIKGKSHQQLIDNLIKAKLIQNAKDIEAFRELDRQLFTGTSQPYENRPYPISKGQTMTDIFTHSIIISNLSNYWKDNVKVLQVGTGHGYLSFLISKILQKNKIQSYSIRAVDINESAIDQCTKLKQKLMPNNNNVQFICQNLSQFLQTTSQQTYDVIIGGYYFDEATNQTLANKLSVKGVGIWPTRSDHGQALYKMEKGRERVYLIQTMFSMPVTRTQVAKYFLEPGEVDQIQTTNVQDSLHTIQEVKIQQLKIIIQKRKEKQQKLKKQLKQLISKDGRKNGQLLKLNQLRQIPSIAAKMKQLQNMSKKLRTVQK